MCILFKYSIYLPFSEIISGPPESPWHESLPLLMSPAQMWNLQRYIVNIKLKWITLSVLLFNLARIIDVALFIRHHSHLNLLECWCWTAISSCVPPPSHRGHLASVQGLGGGGQANGGNGGGEGQGQGQKQYGEIEICILIVVSWVDSDLGDVSSVNLRISCVVFPNKNLHRIKEMNKHIKLLSTAR